MRFRIPVSPAEKRNVTIDRCPPIKSREICTSLNFPDSFSDSENRIIVPQLTQGFYTMPSRLSISGRSAAKENGSSVGQRAAGFIKIFVLL
jgi:hypothetical protein